MTTGGIEDAYPLTAMQSGMIFHNSFEPDTATYHDVLTLTLRGRYDRSALQAVIDEIVAEHPVLRTSFEIADLSEPLQLVHRSVKVPFTEHRLDRSQLRAWRDGEKRRPFDLGAPPLLRAFVHRFTDTGDPAVFALAISFHHAILDGWSLASLVTELLRRYSARLSGRSLPLAPPPVRFRDAVAAERAIVGSDASIGYWRRVVDQAEATALPRLPGYPVGSSEDADTVGGVIDPAVFAGLERVARELRVPVRTVLLAGHLRVMGLHGGTPDVMTGVVTHSRPEHTRGGDVLGMFLNAVPIRVRVDASSWSRLVTAVFEAELAMLAHRGFPLAEIHRVTGRSSLFETLFDYRDFYVYRGLSQVDGLEIVDYDYFDQTNIPFAAGVVRSADNGLPAVHLVYARDQFPAAQMAAVRDAYLRVFASMAADVAGDPRDTAPLIGPEVVRIAGRRGPVREYPAGVAVGFPEPASVVEAEGVVVPGADLGARVGWLAEVLLDRGVGADQVVGVCLDRGVDQLVAVHAVLAAGAAFLPLEPELPNARLWGMAADSGMSMVVTDEVNGHRWRGRGVPVVVVGAGQGRGAVPTLSVPAQALAYVIFTSGSTGRPKGVQVSRAAIGNRLAWMQEVYRLTPADRVLVKTPFSFDVSVWELLLPLWVGASVVVARPGGHRDPDYLADLIGAHAVTLVHFVPSMLSAFLRVPDVARRAAGLRRVVCSGEALSRALVDRFFAVFPEAELDNLYGPTEAAVDVSWHRCRPGEPVVPIGSAVANTRLEVLDAVGARVPVGVPGELCIGGVQLARGYSGRPGSTAQQFVPDLYGPAGGRLYRTGDLARWLPSGEVEFLGRLDDQVKIRGQRIEPAEVTAALAAQPEAGAAAVLAVPEQDGEGKRLVGYVVTDAERFAAVDWRGRLRERLPEFMLPAVVIRLDELPLTANGKLDRGALPAPDAVRLDSPYEEPATDAERAIARVWRDVLGLTRVSARDDFFAVGGNSIRSLMVIARLRQAGYALQTHLLFAHPVLRDLAARLVPQTAAEPAPHTAAFDLLGAADRALVAGESLDDAYPLVPHQTGMVSHTEARPDVAVYSDAFTVTVRGAFDVDALVATLGEVTARHPVLRTSFDFDRFSEPMQLVHPTATIPLTVHTMSTPDDVAERRRVERHRRWSWTEPPLARAHADLLPGGLFALTLVFHHAILDGWSLASVTTEIVERYAARLAGAPLPVTPPKATYRDYVARVRAAVGEQDAAEFWAAQLRGAPVTRLPRPASRPRPEGEPLAVLVEPVPDSVAAELDRAAAALHVPLQTVLLACHLRVLAEVCAGTEVVSGVVTHGRPEEEGGAEVLGMFLNPVPLRVPVTGPLWSDLVRRVREAEVRVVPYRRYPCFGMTGDVDFEFRDFHIYGERATGAGASGEDRPSVVSRDIVEHTHVPLAVNAVRTHPDRSLVLLLNYHSDEFAVEQIRGIAARYRRALAGAARELS